MIELPKKIRDLWISFLTTLPFWLILFGLIIIVIEFLVNNNYINSGNNFPGWLIPIVKLLLSLGRPILIGGIFGSLLKTYQYLGIFRDAVKEVIFEKPWFDETHLRELWKKISSALYKEKLPQALNDFLHEAIIERYFPTNKHFYYADFEVSCIFSWENGKKMVKRQEILRKKVIPFDRQKSIKLPFKLESPQGTDLNLTTLTVNGIDYANRVITNTIGDKFIVEYEIELQGESEYIVERNLLITFSIEDEPFAKFSSVNYIQSVMIHVESLEPDLKITFVPSGTWQEFRVVGHDLPASFTRCYDQLLFPHQGFILVFSRVN